MRSAQVHIVRADIFVYAVMGSELVFRFRVTDEIESIPERKYMARRRIDVHGAVRAADGQHTALRLVADAAVLQALSGQCSADGVAEDGKAFVDHEQLVRREHIEDAAAYQRRQGKHLIRSGAVQAGDVAVQRGAAKDLGITQVRVVANKVRSQEDEDFIRTRIPEEDLLGFIHYDTDVIDADLSGKSPYDFSPRAVEEIRAIKAKMDAK